MGLGEVYIFKTILSPFECFNFSSVVRLGTKVSNNRSRKGHLLFHVTVYYTKSESTMIDFFSLEAKRKKSLREPRPSSLQRITGDFLFGCQTGLPTIL